MIAALIVSGLSLVIYVRTLLPGSSFGDWGEMQLLPASFGVPHPTGYPLYMLLDKAFSLLPVGSPAYRADLLSAVAAAGATGASVLIAIRLGVRPVIAGLAGLTLAVTGTLWLEATFSEMNGLHLFLMALLIHRAIVWRAERRDRDLQLGALLTGLSISNHMLAITVAPFVILFVLIDARSRLIQRPILLVQAALLVLTGVSLYLLIPLRALGGPPDVYAAFLTWDGLAGLITGAQFRGDMHFGSGASLSTAWRAIPDIAIQFQAHANIVFLVAGVTGGALHFLRDRWAASLLAVVAAVNVYVYANYIGNLEHYLLLTWLVLAVGLAIGSEILLAAIERRLGSWVSGTQVLLVLLPLAIAVGNWPTHDQSANRVGEDFAVGVLDELPANAVLLTYWDALTDLSYAHCIDGARPDVSLRAYDPAARVTCDPWTGPLEEVARERPVYALFVFEPDVASLRDSFTLITGPTLALPYGGRGLDHSGVLYRLQPLGDSAVFAP